MSIVFDYNAFIALFPAYSDPTKYSSDTIQAFWNAAINYVSDVDCGILNGDKRAYAINLMTAHLLYISDLIAQGTVPYLMQTATIDKVSIGLTPPPLKSQWQWWLSVSPYGQQLLALFQVISAGGFYIGGSPQRAAFSFNNWFGCGVC